MNAFIQNCVKVLTFATREEICLLLEDDNKVNRRLVDSKLADLVSREALFEVLPEENSLGMEGFIPGPNLEADPDSEVHKKIIDKGVDRRDPSILLIDKIADRIEKDLMSDLESLVSDIANVHSEPRRLELDYFGLTIRYHSWRRYFYENFNYMPFENFKDSLRDCRALLDKLQIE